jgi:CRP-like cAMP-binding protein
MEKAQIRDILEQLKKEKIFYLFTDEDFEHLAPFLEIVDYPKDTVIFKEGDEGDFICFVISGKLEVKKLTEFKGNQIILAILGKGAMVGELSLFDQHYRSATVETAEDTTLLILRNSALDDLIKNHPYIGVKILKGFIRVLSLRLRKATERLTTIF